MAQPLPIDSFFPASPGRRKSPPSVLLRVEKREVHHCGRSRTQGAGRAAVRSRERNIACARCARRRRGESPAVHLLCRGLFRSRIKSVSDAHRFPSFPPPPFSVCPTVPSLLLRVFLRVFLRVLLRLYTPPHATEYLMALRTIIALQPSFAFRLWWKRSGCACASANCKPLPIVLLIRETFETRSMYSSKKRKKYK